LRSRRRRQPSTEPTMPVKDVTQARTTRTADKLLDLPDAQAVVAAAGKSVSPDELKEVAAALVPKGQYEVGPDAATFLRQTVTTLADLERQVAAQNHVVTRRAASLAAEEKAM